MLMMLYCEFVIVVMLGEQRRAADHFSSNWHLCADVQVCFDTVQ